MITSGEAPVVTTTNAVETLLAAVKGSSFRHLKIVNEGLAPGFWRIGSGPFVRMPAQSVLFYDDGDIQITNQVVEVKRVTDSADLADVFAFAW